MCIEEKVSVIPMTFPHSCPGIAQQVMVCNITIICIVSGDANFDMQRTALTVGGFTQPSVGRALIELPASIEKGLTQHFLWIFPKPSFSPFNSLELIEECVEIVKVGNYLQTNAFIAS